GGCARYVLASYWSASARPTSSIRTTSGLTLAYFAWVRKFRARRPKASTDTSSRAIFKYVFITSAEPYNSTNWRLALSIVLGLRSATVADIRLLLPQRLEVQQTGDRPDGADD